MRAHLLQDTALRYFLEVAHSGSLTEASAPRFATPWYAPHEDLSVVDGRTAMGERIIVAGKPSKDAAECVVF